MDRQRPSTLDTDPELKGMGMFLDTLNRVTQNQRVSGVINMFYAKYDTAFNAELAAFASCEKPFDEALAQLIEACADVAEYHGLSPEVMAEILDEAGVLDEYIADDNESDSY